jgi:hypothetical protein
MSFLPKCTTSEEAIKSLERHGACLFQCPDDVEFGEAIAGLYTWCEAADAYMDRHPQCFDRSTRSDNPAEKYLRYSLNDYRNATYPEWQHMLLQLRKHFGSAICNAFNSSQYDVHSCGGDVVRPMCLTGQLLHGDGYEERPSAGTENDFEWLVVSIAVHEIDRHNAPLCFVGIDAMMEHDSSFPPRDVTALCPPLDHDSCALVMSPGDIFIRDPRVWHCGTPNTTGCTRYLPGCVLKGSA